MPSAPHVSINLAAFTADPYPILAELRRSTPVAFVPELGATLLTRRDDVFHWEKETATFSSDQPHGLMNRLMGQNMMRKDGPAHMAERKIYFQAVSPKAVAQTWVARFQRHADRILDGFNPETPLDLIAAFALPLAAECLKEMTGLTNVTYQTMDGWSQALIAGIANYAGDPGVEAACLKASAEIDQAIDARLSANSADGAPDLLSVMLAAGMPLDNVRHNIKLTISGGQNEPRKAIAGCIWALLNHPDQLSAAQSGMLRWLQVFEEYIRWIAPIGMSPRRIAQPVEIHGVPLAPEERVFLMFNAANRDETYFTEPDRFIATRDTTKAIAFGAGPHFCAGAWAARAMVADVALPSVFRRWPNLQLDPREPITINGWAFRGLVNLPVTLGRAA